VRIVLVGAGLVGTQLTKHLIQEKHDVALIESNVERARHASNRLDCLVIQKQGNHLASLEEAGIAKADALVCVTDSDEVNMITCGLAESRYPSVLKIARVRNLDYSRLNDLAELTQSAIAAPRGSADLRVLGIDHFIHPDVEAARAVLSALSHGAMGNILSFVGSGYELGSIDIAPESPFDGLCLKDFRSLIKGESLITLVERGPGEERESFLPTGSTVLARGDRIHILAQEAEMNNSFRLAGRSEKPLRRIGIVGGGRLGVLIAGGILGKTSDHGEGLEQTGKTGGKGKKIASLFKSLISRTSRRVVIIEEDYQVCKDLAARFPEALILNEDITDQSFIAEERIGELDLIITASANQEFNMITAIYLKSRGVSRSIALVSSSGYENIARQLGVDVVIPTESVVVDSILSHLMGGEVKGIHRLGDRSVGIFEIEIKPDSPAVDMPITRFRLDAGGLLLLVYRGEDSFIPQGDYEFKSGDKIAIMAKNGSDTEIEKFFGVSK
jgi:trk system potassium uptake protein TrkA